ncbi:hypothetical protein TorRG33x02_255250 [Trema orientale]|uniref:Prolamin-like domain containing protein n=1 Tax=Trema orientale TaxID=63057 RepID=A0A2P5DD64_TREOI|nr:hypothetical protein TorRG33x02_342390 [Trema orientale]PON71233.1 hypothetical protein TorRG33x02_255250 [Trema orientale]
MPFGCLSCIDQFFRYQPCVFEILNLNLWGHPISTSCCATILDVANGNCPRPLPYSLFVKGKDYCAKVASPPPPSDGDSQKKCVFAPCYKEMADFYNKNIPITTSCCVFIQDVLARCPDFRGDFTSKCKQYCKNHKQSGATPPRAS